MTEQEIEAFLRMGSNEEEVAELLRQQQLAEGEVEATRGRDYRGTGRGYRVANPWGAVSDMFVRGNAQKRADKAGGEAANRRAGMNETMRDFFRAAAGKGLGGVDLNAQPTQSAIAGNSRPLMQAPIPQGPVMGGPPPAGPVGPPGPAAAAPPPAALPAPARPPVPAAAPPGVAPVRQRLPSGKFQTNAGWDDIPGLPKSIEDLVDEEAKLLRQGAG